MSYMVMGRRVSIAESEGATLEAAIAAFRAAFPDYQLEGWERNGDDDDFALLPPAECGDFHGCCEGCGRWFTDPGQYDSDQDGILVCKGDRCPPGATEPSGREDGCP